MQMEHREFEIRNADVENREVTGIAVPYNEVTQIGRMKEKFSPNSVVTNKLPKLFLNHNEPIGRVLKLDDQADGLHITAKISDTRSGQDAWELVKDGVIRSFSVGFVPMEHSLDGDVVVRSKIDLKEISLVALPAYEGAVVTEIRNEQATENNLGEIKNMETQITETVDLKPAIDDLDRRLAVVETTKIVTPASYTVRSYGDYVKGLVNGDENSQTLYRALTTVSDASSVVRPQWTNEIQGIIDLGRPAVNAFSTASLPASGMSVYFPKVTAVPTTAVQSAEGDELSNTEMTIGSGNASVKTIGGFNQVSRQLIERSDPSYIDALFRLQSIAYAKKTDQECLAVLTAEDANYGNASASAGTAQAYLTAVADLAVHIYKYGGLQANFVLVSGDVFKELVGLVDGVDRPLFAALNPTNNIGSSQIATLQGNLFGLPVIVDPNLASEKMYVCSSQAITNWESAGAPFRISQDDVTNLTNEFAVYGYMATTLNNVNGIGRITF
jgi:HK97 family phage prohead protease